MIALSFYTCLCQLGNYRYPNWPSLVGLQSLCNRSFWWYFCVVTLLFGFFCQCRGFCHRTESDLFLLLFGTEFDYHITYLIMTECFQLSNYKVIKGCSVNSNTFGWFVLYFWYKSFDMRVESFIFRHRKGTSGGMEFLKMNMGFEFDVLEIFKDEFYVCPRLNVFDEFDVLEYKACIHS